jgi:hypothetical protein
MKTDWKDDAPKSAGLQPLLTWMLALLLASCSPSASEDVGAGKFGTFPDSAGLLVTREQFGEKWPLTVDRAYVGCVIGRLALIKINGKTYGLTGAARAQGYPPLDNLWRDNPDLPGAKVTISPLTELALKQCK